MRRLTTLSAATAIAALLAGGASAQGLGGGFGEGPLYLKGFGGATFPSTQTETLRAGRSSTGSRLNFDFDTGYTLGASLGYFFTPNFATEIEYAYRDADVTTRLRGGGGSVRVPNSNDGRVDAFMLNALYVFDGMGAEAAVRPYLGGGLGAARTKLSVDGNWDTDWNLAYQLIGGVGYQVAPQWTLFAEGRWFGTERGKFDGPGNRNFSGSFETFDVLVGAAYAF